MTRFTVALFALPALALFTACPNRNPISCGDLKSFNTSSCSAADFAQLDLANGGLWNVSVTYPDGNHDEHVLNLASGQEGLDGLPALSSQVNSGGVYVSVGGSRSGNFYRFSYVGCALRANSDGGLDPHHFAGLFQWCVNNTLTTTGVFQAGKLDWNGEPESSHLALVGEAALDAGVGVNVAVDGGFAYVAGDTTLTVFDVRNPAQPTILQTFTAPDGDSWNDVKLWGNTLYLATVAQGLLVLDVSNPALPTVVAQVPNAAAAADAGLLVPGFNALSIDQPSNTLYASTPYPRPEIISFDISNPMAPVQVATFQAPGADVNTNAWPKSVFTLNNRLYIGHRALGLEIADVSNRAAPASLGSFSQGDSSAYVQAGVFGSHTIAYVTSSGWNGHLRLADVTTLTSILGLAQFSLRPETSSHEIVLSGNKLYMTHFQSGVRVLSLDANGNNPTQVGFFNSWRPTDPGRGFSFYEGAMGLAVPGDGYVYATDTSRGLLVLHEN